MDLINVLVLPKLVYFVFYYNFLLVQKRSDLQVLPPAFHFE
jgi:hypothetical protein